MIKPTSTTPFKRNNYSTIGCFSATMIVPGSMNLGSRLSSKLTMNSAYI